MDLLEKKNVSNGRVAALDLGSNSFHLLIARIDSDKIRYLDRQKEVGRLAAGLDANNRLSDEVAERAFAALHRFSEIIDGIEPDSVRVAGTNTLRTLCNADEFLEKAESILGVPINIISGIEEARLIYLGVTQDLAPSDKRRLVVDIGGGSTELIVGKGLAPKRLESLYMGCVNISQRFFANGAISKKAMREAILAARLELQGSREILLRLGWSMATGSSGDRKSTRLNSSHTDISRMPSSA